MAICYRFGVNAASLVTKGRQCGKDRQPFHSLLNFDISVIVQIKWKFGFVFSKFWRGSGKVHLRAVDLNKKDNNLEAVVIRLPCDADEGCDPDSACEEHGRVATILV